MALRIVTWNVCRGPALDRSRDLDPLGYDLAVLQECARPRELEHDDRTILWLGGAGKQGVALVARNGIRVEALEQPVAEHRSTYPAMVHHPRLGEIRLLAVWAQKEGSYVRAVEAGLTRHRNFLLGGRRLIVGDFNSCAFPENATQSRAHRRLVARLETELGLVSAYHVRHGDGPEALPTYYHLRRQDRPFHIDYCFVPAAWRSHVREATVGGYAEWAARSDHRPLVVEIADDEAPAA